MLRYLNGDLVELAKEGKYDIIIHGCNCFNTMGAGIAISIAREFPKAFEVDQKTLSGDKAKLGTITCANVLLKNGKKLLIVNAYTQFDFRRPNYSPFSYDALKNCFTKIKELFGNMKLKFGIPKIGAGLAGGDWKKIEPIIDRIMSTENVDVIIKES